MIIAPHGGRLISRMGDPPALSGAADCSMPEWEIPVHCWLDLALIANGALSPLAGFMDRRTLESVLADFQLPDGTAWTMPVLLPVRIAGGAAKSVPARVALTCPPAGRVGLLEVQEVFTFDRRRLAEGVYGSADPEHPGVKLIQSDAGVYAAGPVTCWVTPPLPDGVERLTPQQTRRTFAERGWKRVAAFHTRNVPHRAHEYLIRTALEIADGVLIHPIVGWKKEGDFRCEAIAAGYQALIDAGYFPRDRVVFSTLHKRSEYAGAREAVFHAIIRQNFGCAHMIIGRDHAGSGRVSDPYASHRVFDRLAGKLAVQPLLMSGPFYCRACQGIATDKSCGHPIGAREEVSGSIIRRQLRSGSLPPSSMMREEVVRVLQEHIKRETAFV